MLRKRTSECPECGGVMKSVWHDGKTRIHALRCIACGHETERHQNQTDYIELRHFNNSIEDVLGGGKENYSTFLEAAKELNRETTDEAFTPRVAWAAVRVKRAPNGDYVAAAYNDLPEEGEGAGPDQDLPYGQPDVSWSAKAVVVYDAPLKMVDVNDGSAWVYLEHVRDIDIENQGNLIRIRA